MADEARETWTQALGAAQGIKNGATRAGALRDIAWAQAEAGMANEALAAAQGIKDDGARARALTEIAGALPR
jgi:hypothetical protein